MELTRGRVFYGWWIVGLGSLISAVGMGILYHSFTVFFLPLKRDLMLSSAAVSLLFGASRLEGGAEGVITGHLIDRFGPRVVIIGGVTLAGTGFLLLSLVHSFLSFFLVYILVVCLGYNAGFFHPVSAAVNSWFIRRRGTVFAIIIAAGAVGGIVMAPLLSYVILNHGWRTAAVIAGLMILAIGLPAALPIHRSPEVRGLRPDGDSPPENHTDEFRPASPAATEIDFAVREALKTPNYWLLTLSITLRIFVTVALAAHIVPILVWKGMAEAQAAWMVSLFSFTAIITTLAMGWVGDRWSKTRLCSVGILATMLGLVGLVVSEATAFLYAFPIAMAVAMGVTPLNWSLVGDFFGRRSYATLRGIMATVYGTATFFSPIYAGWMFDRTGSYATVLITFSLILLVSAFLFATLRRPLPPPRMKSRSPIAT